jgi:hypothetical protein
MQFSAQSQLLSTCIAREIVPSKLFCTITNMLQSPGAVGEWPGAVGEC